MANPEQVEILKLGVEVWNKWRGKNQETLLDLSSANLSSADLRNADLRSADLSDADLSDADLFRADLFRADLSSSILTNASLREAILWEANLSGAKLENADFTNARLNRTIFADTDLALPKGLNSVRHYGPSEIGISALYKSGGNIPEAFMRGCGVPDTFIIFARSLVGNVVDFYSAFISYSSKNSDIAERLYADLQSKGVRCWFAPEDIKIGDKFRQQIDEAIRIHDKLLLILSKDSIASAWVEEEVESALEKEHKRKKPVLFPVRIDGAVIKSKKAWAASLRRIRHIGDFSNWKDHDAYQKAFNRLLRDLKAEGSS